MALSKTQIDRLGDRMRKGSVTESDLRLLDEYRRLSAEAYESTVQLIREHLHLEPTGRPAKTTGSIIDKLRRESIRLSQIQDIAGCRIVVDDSVEQDRLVASLRGLFPEASVVDRREKPSYGYRAVHVIPKVLEKCVEIQVRSFLQQLWARLSEKMSDVIDRDIKYGGGPDHARLLLASISENVKMYEDLEHTLAGVEALDPNAIVKDKEAFEYVRKGMIDLKHKLADNFNQAMSWAEQLKGAKP